MIPGVALHIAQIQEAQAKAPAFMSLGGRNSQSATSAFYTSVTVNVVVAYKSSVL